MSDSQTDFPEGDLPGKFLDGDLVKRMAAFLLPHRRLVIVAVLLIPLCIGLELLLPFITRTAIDIYLVPYYLRLDADGLDTHLRQALGNILPDGQIPPTAGSWYIREKEWCDLDPALITRMREAGTVDSVRWYAATADGQTENLADRYPEWFQRSGNRILIREDHLKSLGGEDLKQLRRSDAFGLIGMAALFTVMAAALLAVSFFQTVCLERAGQEMMKDLRLFLFHHILTRSQSFFSDNPIGKLVTRMNNDVQSIAE